MLLTIEGIDDLRNRGPGKRQSKPRGFREVIEVQASRTDPSICVAARFGAAGAANGRRMVDLCREAGLSRMRIAGRDIDLGEARETDMSDYSETEFPPIEDLEDLDALIPAGYLMDNLVVLGANLAARTLGDATRALPGPAWLRPLVKVGAGLAGGRALWGMNRDAGLMATGTLFGSALYDDLLKPMVLSRFFPTVFGESVDLPEERILEQLTDEERALLEGSVEESDHERTRLSGGVEEQDVMENAVDQDRRDEVEVSSLGQWLQ